MAGPDAKPICVILAGPNGAGKSTAAPFLLSGIPQVREFVNADTIARGLSAFDPDSVAFKADRLMLERLDELATNGVSFSFETTPASHCYVRRLRAWKEKHGYRLLMFYLWLPDPETAIHRVRARVAMGGHDVPEETIVRRWHRSRRNFLESYRGIMDEWYVFVASDEKALRCFAYQIDETNPKVLEANRWIALTDTKVVTSTDSDAVGGVSERLGSSERAMAKADDHARRLHKALGVPLVVVTSTGWREIPPEEIVVDPPIR